MNDFGPGTSLRSPGTAFSEERFSQLVASFRDRNTGRLTFGDVDLRGAEIPGGADFCGAKFTGTANFSNAKFHKLRQEADRHNRWDSDFDEAEFEREALFSRAEFIGAAGFKKAIFTSEANFREVKFTDEPRFVDTEFHANALFENCLFEGVTFAGAQFGAEKEAAFTGATFRDRAWFGGAHFRGRSWFDSTRFQGLAIFGGGAQFTPNLDYDSAIFEGRALFRSVLFAGHAYFGSSHAGGAEFRGGARFGGCRFAGAADFTNATFGDGSSLSRCEAMELTLIGARMGRETQMEWEVKRIDAYGVSCPQGLNLQLSGGFSFDASTVRSLGELSLSYKNEEIRLSGAAFDAPAIIAAVEAGTAPRLLSIDRVDATNLTLSGLNLNDCHFLKSYNLDQLRIDGPPGFDTTPKEQLWTRRKILAEERIWRARYDRRREGWCRKNTSSYPEADAELEDDDLDSDATDTEERNHHDVEKARDEAARIQAVYRDLRKAREDQKDEPGAADFYYGEMEMRRLAAPPKSVDRWLLTAYWLISGYGLRATRALVALVLLFALGVVGFATFGFAPSTTLEYRAIRGKVGAYRQVAVSGPRPGWGEAADQSAQGLLGVFRSPPQRALTPQGQTLQIALRLLGAVSLGLTVLAVRGRVKR